ncbi:hypothetical protein FO519_008492 [Halicephalobus sp. NKZ332]|nr:hypothetical protein FO519_008492 [Halicephalobus sp. NKZ332]
MEKQKDMKNGKHRMEDKDKAEDEDKDKCEDNAEGSRKVEKFRNLGKYKSPKKSRKSKTMDEMKEEIRMRTLAADFSRRVSIEVVGTGFKKALFGAIFLPPFEDSEDPGTSENPVDSESGEGSISETSNIEDDKKS